MTSILQLATFASNPFNSQGRFIEEPGEKTEYCFLKDRERIIHSVAFRRLEYKTQVFINYVGDHYRTRLTHTLEVSQIARTICRYLGLNEDLAEAIALCHDLGHPPFGHAGEYGLNEAAKDYGGFEHNLHTIKILTKLEHRHLGFQGLNLTWETIEGVLKHNGPIYKDISPIIAELSARKDLYLDKFPSLEAQVANLADDIAYIAHDIDDGIRAGFFEITELEEVEAVWQIYLQILKDFGSEKPNLLANELVRKISQTLKNDLVATTLSNIKLFKINSVEDIRNQTTQTAAFSESMEITKNKLKAFLTNKVYRNYRVNRMTIKGQQVLQKIFQRLIEKPECLPTEWFLKTKHLQKAEFAGIITDYIAGMTDRYAIEEYNKLFDPNLF